MIYGPEDMSVMPADIVKLIKGKKYFGQMNDPSGSAYIRGICGDQMEFYIVVIDNIITDIKFHTDGCVYTFTCGSMVCELVKGRPIQDALSVSAGRVITEIKVLAKSHVHCAILAVSTLYKAIADYLLKP
ncbi:MAG: iron-sulfur cluster assembly scaffold protein [Candidatus Omnitrophota bacterium]|jgi:nitrogen fixation NifU-like protein